MEQSKPIKKTDNDPSRSDNVERSKAKHLKNWQSSRSVVAVMRDTKAYHMHLTVLSDQKANIVIAAASIILTVSISQLGRFEGILLYALMVITFFTTIALLLSILSVAPFFTKANRKMTIDSEGFNPFFFGHFSDISYDEYYSHMIDIFKDQDQLYESLILDVYQIGEILKKQKFKYLNLSYKIFFLGILIGLIMFLSSLFF